MKARLIILGLLLVTIASNAQSTPWCVSLLAGQQLQSADIRSGSSFALTADYFFTEHFALTGGVSSFEGKLEHDLPWQGDSIHSGLLTHFHLQSRFYILSVGPTLSITTSQHSRLFVSLRVGHTIGSTTGREYTVLSYDDGYQDYYPSSGDAAVVDMRENKFTFGAVLGWRHFFNQVTGFELQASYDHYPNGYLHFIPQGSFSDQHYIAFRAGITFRF